MRRISKNLLFASALLTTAMVGGQAFAQSADRDVEEVVVTASIWRHALDWPLPAGVGISLVLFVVEFGFDRLLFAGTTG